MLGHRRAVDRVVGGHDAPGVGVLDDDLEGHQVQLAQGAFAHGVVHREAVGLGVVGDEVLDGGADTAGLNAVHIARADRARQVRVLAVGLEVPAAERGPVQVDRRGKEHMDILAAGLLGQQHPCPAGEFGVPGGGEGGRGRQRHGRVVGGPADAPDADRAVGHDEGLQADLGERGQRPHVLAGEQPGLRVEVEPGEGGLDDRLARCIGLGAGSRHRGASSLSHLHVSILPGPLRTTRNRDRQSAGRGPTAATTSTSTCACGRNSFGTSKVMLVGGVPVRNCRRTVPYSSSREMSVR